MRITYRITLLFFAVFLAYAHLNAQSVTITGTVWGKSGKSQKELLEGVVIGGINTSSGTTTGSDGRYTLTIPDSTRAISASYIGYMADTILLIHGTTNYDFELIPQRSLKEVTIRRKNKSTQISLAGPIKMEMIGQKELMKAACCNLSESFETTPSVDVSFTDAVTGYKQIKLLGLSGPYTLITRENIPDIRGLGAVTGLTFTPGTWIEGMQLSKGTGSVVNGFESVAGQINVELQKPFEGEKWLFNVYQSSQGRSELNVNYRHKFSDKIGTNLLVHANSQWLKTDYNDDHFLDAPLGKQVNLLNRWIYLDSAGWMVQAGVKGLYTKGAGGEWNFTENTRQIPGNPWGYKNQLTRLEDWVKVAKVIRSRPGTSIGLQLANNNHDQDASYGNRIYTAKQNNFYANFIFQTYISNTNNIIKLGASTQFDKYDEQFEGVSYKRNEQVPGVFAEYAYNYLDKFNVVAGVRWDNNNIYGSFFTPRLHVRYAPFKQTVVRLSAGRAQRTANILAENLGYMAGNRQFDISGPVVGKAYGLDPEVAWNAGGNLTQKFRIGLREAVFSADYYYTTFESQVVLDIEYLGYYNFSNLRGRSFAHGFQAQFDYELLHNLNLRLAYRYYNVMVTYRGELKEKPFTPPHRAFINVDYTTRSKWKFDYTVQWISSQRTPGITHNHSGITAGGINQSPSYIQMNAQITKVLSEVFDVYLGCENITNYMQHDAIQFAADPYNRYFDASMIWGPMMGRNLYLGLRYRIN